MHVCLHASMHTSAHCCYMQKTFVPEPPEVLQARWREAARLLGGQRPRMAAKELEATYHPTYTWWSWHGTICMGGQ